MGAGSERRMVVRGAWLNSERAEAQDIGQRAGRHVDRVGGLSGCLGGKRSLPVPGPAR